MLLTDGLANIGLGNLEEEAETAPAFYTSLATEAAASGIAISVVAIDGAATTGGGVKVGLEYLGRLSDTTGGTVEFVNPMDLATTALGASSALEKTLATRVSVTVLAGSTARSHFSSSSSLLSSPPSLATLTKREQASDNNISHRVQRFTRQLGRVTANASDVAFEYFINGISNESSDSPDSTATSFVPIQIQLRYTLPDGTIHLRVRTLRQPVTRSRAVAESAVNSAACSLSTVQSAAALAEQGKYEAARIQLMSHVRLLQRSMTTVSGQEAYLNFVCTAERLDQFMRQQQAEEVARLQLEKQDQLKSLQSTNDEGSPSSAARCSDRDDDSSSVIFQMKRLSLSDFHKARLPNSSHTALAVA